MKKRNKNKKENRIFWVSLGIIIVCLLIVFSFVSILDNANNITGNSILGDVVKDTATGSETGFLNTLFNFWGGFLDVLGIQENQIGKMGGEDCGNSVCDIGETNENCPVDCGENLVLNPEFENDWQNWSHSHNAANTGSESIVTSGCYSGKCVKMISNDSNATRAWQVTYQTIGKLIQGRNYKLSARFNTSENHFAYINLYDNNWKNASGYNTGKSFTSTRAGNNNWKEISVIVKIPLIDRYGESTLEHNWSVYLYGQSPAGNLDPIYYDNIRLEEYNLSVDFGGCVNNENSICLDFGSQNENNAEFNLGVLGINKSEGAINYREILPKSILYVNFSEFNVDSDGLPLSDMLLEIMYEDVLESDSLEYSSGINTNHRIFIDLKNNFENNDSLYYNYGNKNEYTSSYAPYASLGEFNDSEWKTEQIPIQKTQFTLLKSVNGKFAIRIRMPTNYPEDSSIYFPIDYIALKSISHEEYLKITGIKREMLGFYQGDVPRDESEILISYSNPSLVTFTRDIMEPVYNSTKPKQEELTEKISGFSTLGEIEPLSFGIYSETGISNLNFSVSDLVMNNYQISKDRINIYEVVEAESWANVYGTTNYKSYTFQPDRIEDISSLDVGKNSSKRIWIKVYVPDNIPSGVYNGKLDIKQAGSVLKSIEIDFNVSAIKLDEPESLNSVYHDPYIKMYSSNNSEVFRFYRETGLVPFYYAPYSTTQQISAIRNSSGAIIDYNLTGFEKRLDRMISEGVVKDRMIVELAYLWQYLVYQDVYGTAIDSNVYYNLSDSRFVDAFSLTIKKLIDISKARNISFIFSAGDEPGVDPYKRIVIDRIFTIIKANNGNTTITYYTSCENEIDSGSYNTPDGKIPSLTPLVDYKIWAPSSQGKGYLKNYSNYGYYTTYSSNVRNPIYNRFLHGALVLKTDAVAVSVYAMGDWVGDPWSDFDKPGHYISPFTYPDFLLAYPTWDGKLIPTMASEGLREGIKDDKYFETLKRLIRENPGNPASVQAQNYLDSVKIRISPEYWYDYANKGRDYGSYESILQNLSETNNPQDFEAFTTIRQNVLNYILEINKGFCGDGNCSSLEDCSSCSVDCGACPCTNCGGDNGGGDNGGGGGITPKKNLTNNSQSNIDLGNVLNNTGIGADNLLNTTENPKTPKTNWIDFKGLMNRIFEKAKQYYLIVIFGFGIAIVIIIIFIVLILRKRRNKRNKDNLGLKDYLGYDYKEDNSAVQTKSNSNTSTSDSNKELANELRKYGIEEEFNK